MAKEEYTAEQWYQSALDGAAEDQFTGGGVVGLMRVDLGYKTFIAGMTGKDFFKTFFPVRSVSKKARAGVLAEAKEFGQANGATKNPAWAVALTMYKEECVTLSGEPVGWAHDQQKTISMWPLIAHPDKPGGAKAFMTAQKESRAPTAKDFYGRVSWINDPYKESLGEAGKTEEDKRDGTYRFPTVAIIADVYKNKASAQAAAAKFAAEAPDNGTAPVEYPWSDFPGDWGDDEDWVGFAADAEMALHEDGTAAEYAEDELGEDLTFLYRALSVGGFKNRKIKDITGAKMSEIKAALAPS